MPTDTIIKNRLLQFCTEIAAIVRADVLRELEEKVLGVVQPTLPALPRRKTDYTPYRSRALPQKLLVDLDLENSIPDAGLTGVESTIVDALHKRGDQSSTEIAKYLCRAESTVRGQLGRLVKKGAVRREEQGGRVVYTVVDAVVYADRV